MDKLYTVKESVAILRISGSALNRLFAKREIGRVKIAGRVMLSEQHIQEYIARNTISPKWAGALDHSTVMAP